jgi:hypothetical protein
MKKKHKLYYYDYIYKILSNIFIKDILNNIFNFLYPKVYLNLKLHIIYQFDILNSNISNIVILYHNLSQQNCKLCGHLETIVKDDRKKKFKIILLNNKYKCNCNLNLLKFT